MIQNTKQPLNIQILAYLRASTREQDAERAKSRLKEFVQGHGLRVSSWFIENESGTTLHRPKLLELLEHAERGDILLIEQVDRLSRLSEEDWESLKAMINNKGISIVSLDLPSSHIALTPNYIDDFTSAIIKATNNMMLDVLAAVSRKDYEDRRRRQAEGIAKAKDSGVYRGRTPDLEKHKLIQKLRLEKGCSINETAKLVGVSRCTVIRVTNAAKESGLGLYR